MENKGIFLYLDSINALDTLWSDALKWRIVRAVTMYAVLGELPDEKLQKNAVFMLMKSIVDNGKTGQKRKKGGNGEGEAESINNSGVEGCSGGGEKSGESVGQSLCVGEEKLVKVNSEKTKSEHYNKNKNKNKNENKNSSSCVSEDESVGKRTGESEVEEEEKIKSRRVVFEPTLSEVQEFIDVTKVKVDAVCFFEYHRSKNWRVGGRNVSDWRACVLEWDRRERRKEARAKEKEMKSEFNSRNYTKDKLDGLFDDLDEL